MGQLGGGGESDRSTQRMEVRVFGPENVYLGLREATFVRLHKIKNLSKNKIVVR